MSASVLGILGILPIALANWNNEIGKDNCAPADCSQDGSCYCSNKFDGWGNGGAGFGVFRTLRGDQSYCWKQGRGDCMCRDCGFGDDKCRDFRCNDEHGYYSHSNGKRYCYKMDPVKGRVWTDEEWYNDCYLTKTVCDLNRCAYGENLAGCQRVSPGKCESCGALGQGNYWIKRGRCDKGVCSAVNPGYYITSPCTSTANAEVHHCSEHIGNPNASAFPNPIPQYYCPGGSAVPIHVPAFATVNAQYSDFNCQPGYSKHASECRACLPGSACMHDKSYTCKTNYYTDRYAQSQCKRCTSSCQYSTEVPLRCQEGSNLNSRCVTCGLCGQYPATGVNCVRDLEAFQKLPITCTPLNVESDVTVCEEG